MADSDQPKALNLDLGQQQSFIRFFNDLPEKPYSTVRFFNRSDYYTLHDDDASLAANFTSAQIKYMGNQPKLSYVCINKGMFETFLWELLLVRQYRVEVYVKTKEGRNNNDWHVEYKGSPGNLSQFEEILFENASVEFTNYVMAVKIIQSKILAIGCVNITECKFEVCEINDNESFTDFESLLAQISPKECLIPTGDSTELQTLKALLERNGILVAKIKKSDFSNEDIMQDLNRLLFFHEDQQKNASVFQETNMNEAMSCLQALIRFLNLTVDERNFNQFRLSMVDVKRYVRLDNAALYALHVMPKLDNKLLTPGPNFNTSKTASLRGLLDHCVTSQGRRLLEQWIKQPLRDLNLLNERLDIVESFVKDSECRNILIKEHLPCLSDLMPLSRKINSKKANLQDCFKVYQTISYLPRLVNLLMGMEYKCVRAMLSDPINDITSDMQKYQAMIEQTLDLDLVDRGEYLVKASFDEELTNLHARKGNLEEKMQKQLWKVADDLDLEAGKSVKLECNDMHGYFFRVTMKEEKALRKKKDYKILDAIKGGLRFTNDTLVDFNQEYQNINAEYRERQKTVADEIYEVACGYADSLRNLNILFATLDVLVSFAVSVVSARIPYTRPKLHKEGTGILRIKKLRHPCLEAQDSMAFIPNDVDFQRENKILHIITGPNMCGKSTYIRSVGTCVLMAQIGSFVPCAQAEISLVDGILVRVGADDCQLKGLSTFMLEMIETSSIIKSATENSLVIIDELGRGTSTYDGCGIAWAIAEHLVTEKRCFSLFATHYHEVTRLAEENDNINNLHVTAIITEDTITPLYQIKLGGCDKSYGIYCAKMTGFPEDVIKEAINYQKELEHHYGKKYISNFQQAIKRKVIAEGDAIIQASIKKLNSMNVGQMTDEELEKNIEELKDSLKTKENLFIKGFTS